eukprot:TRINITY_DN7067_c0_g1_i1.p1 TRINITY_DN7067_c0_g1~~TRINITY_DN7067_c0_g1_i1.p1  ORF type:complete len:566 (-),score=85.11 TRINITY_DN7067_c0_g1_i1:20-1639(-)
MGDVIKCDHCDHRFSTAQFENHAGDFTSRNPYKTIFVVESGKCLHDYRYCMYCHTTETPIWRQGPYGERTLCDSCGLRWERKEIDDNVFSRIIDSSKGNECRIKTEGAPAPPTIGSGDEHAPNVRFVKKIPITEFTLEMFQEYVLEKREPIVLTNALEKLNKEIWTFEHLLQKHPDTEVTVRYMQLDKNDQSQFETVKDSNKKMDWFIHNVQNENNQQDPDFDTECVSKGRTSVMYAKDFSFGEKVPEWLKDLKPILPNFITPGGPHDLMSYLDQPARPIVWMAYMGKEGSRTPLHLDKVASIAINLHTIGEGTKLWWLLDPATRDQLEQKITDYGGCFWRDSFWMSPSELEATGFPMWFHEQQRGEMMIVPPMVPHTVINSGPLSVAVAANILNDYVVQESWQREQVNRTIGRSSIYRLKPTIFHAVKTLVEKDTLEPHELVRLRRILPVWQEMLDQEKTDENPSELEDDWFICDGCGTDIFNKRFHCGSCKAGNYDLCVQCYNQFGKEHYHKPMQLFEKYPKQLLLDLLNKAQAKIA